MPAMPVQPNQFMPRPGQMIRATPRWGNQPMPMGQPPQVRGGQQQFKLTNTVRNVPSIDNGMVGMVQPAPQAPIPTVDGQEPLTSSMLAAANPQEQKQMLGERLFPLIQQMATPDLAGKITGMLLEIDNSELLQIHRSKNKCLASVYSLLFSKWLHLIWQVKSLVCCWKLIIRNCCICWTIKNC